MFHLGATLRHWHRRLGVVAATFLVWLAVTGVLINESRWLGLDGARVDWPWLMAFYGLRASPPAQGYAAAGHWLAQAGDQAIVDGRALAPPAIGAAVGLVSVGSSRQPPLYAAGDRAIALLAVDGSRVDTLDASSLPAVPLHRIGTLGDHQVVIDVGQLFESDDGANWTPLAVADGDAVRWSVPAALPARAQAQAAAAARPSLPALRVIEDLHSGRLFGPVGVRVIDLAALLATWLAASGVWMVLRAQRRHHQPPRGHHGS